MFITWYLYQETGDDSDGYTTEDGVEYEGRLRVARFDPLNGSFDLYLEQLDYFGHASAIVHGEWSDGLTSRVYIGGAADNAAKADDDTREWGTCIVQLKDDDLTIEEQWWIKMEGNWRTSRPHHPMIDHMKLHKGSTDYIFGTTRTHLRPLSHGTGSRVFIFKIKLTSDHKIDNVSANNLETVKLDMESALGVDSRITGISNEMVYHNNGVDMGIDIIVFNPTTKRLWYIRATFNTWSYWCHLLNDDIDYVRESFFAGTNTGSVNFWNENWFKQSYSVGYAKLLTNANTNTLGNNSGTMGIVLATLKY